MLDAAAIYSDIFYRALRLFVGELPFAPPPFLLSIFLLNIHQQPPSNLQHLSLFILPLPLRLLTSIIPRYIFLRTLGYSLLWMVYRAYHKFYQSGRLTSSSPFTFTQARPFLQHLEVNKQLYVPSCSTLRGQSFSPPLESQEGGKSSNPVHISRLKRVASTNLALLLIFCPAVHQLIHSAVSNLSIHLISVSY